MTGPGLNKWIERMSPTNAAPVAVQETSFPAMGGTEILLKGLKENTKVDEYDFNLLLSTPDPNKIQYSKKNILWQHLNYDDESVAIMSDKSFIRNLSATVYVSNWQFEKYRYFHNVPLSESYVVKNAIQPIEFKERSKDGKIKLIYTSAPFRGLDLLLDVFEHLDRDDIELDVYSSNEIYGSGYKGFVGSSFDPLFNRAKGMKNVNYIGYASNDEVKSALTEAHIFAYPSTFEETCCLAMVEAGAAGCKMVTTNLGALYETGTEYATLVPIKSTGVEMLKAYSDALSHEIDSYWDTASQELIRKQSEYFNSFYSWDRRSEEWNRLFEQVCS